MPENFSNQPEQRIFSAEKPPELHDGYNRPPEIENQIGEVLQSSERELTARLRSLKGETLVCLLTLARAENLPQIEDLIAPRLARIAENIARRFLKAKDFSENFIEEAVGDLVFEMFSQILRRGQKSFDFWEVNFYVALERLTRSFLRKRAAQARATETFSELSGGDGEGEFEFENSLPKFEALTIEEKLEIKDIVAKMPEQTRKIFILYYVEDWKQAQIAEVFTITTRTVRSRLKEADALFKNYLTGGEK